MVRRPQDIEGRPAYVQGFGGDTSTAIIAAARQGARTAYLSAVGDDVFGHALRDLWTREGVDHSHVLTNRAAETGVCFIDPDPKDRQFTYARQGSAAASYDVPNLPEHVVEEAAVLHLSGITLGISPSMRASAFAAMERANTADTLVSLDLNFRLKLWSAFEAAGALMKAARKADIIFASDDEAAALFELTSPNEVASFFLDLGAQIVVAKSGADGALLATSTMRREIPPAPSKPVDSSGAGDSFAGAFLAWFVETGDAEFASEKAAVVAAATVSGFGAVEPIPRR